MLDSSFSTLDWLIFGSYFLALAISSYLLSRTSISSTRDYFVSQNTMPLLAVAISVVATSQSAATFLGAPEYSYKGDLTFIGFYISALLAVIFVSFVLVPRFYAHKCITVYELLGHRYGLEAKKQASVMFLVGRIIASGARLYIGSIAISMILFSDITIVHIALSTALLLLGSLSYTYFGGIKSIIYSDVLQASIYIGSAFIVLWYLYTSLDGVEIFALLDAKSKLKLFDTASSNQFNIIALLSGWLLLNIAAFGLDQDMTQRVLTCKNGHEATLSLIISIIITIFVVLLFLAIGSLLYLHYEKAVVDQSFAGESVTIFMYYILTELPDGLKAVVTVGVVATTLSSTNSVLGALSSVAIEDLYRPWQESRSTKSEDHFVRASKVAVLLATLALFLMALLSYVWQNYTSHSLLSFALGVMAYSYTGLLGIYFSAIFTKRGNSRTTLLALVVGFLSVLLLGDFGLQLPFAHQISIGTLLAFASVQLGSQK